MKMESLLDCLKSSDDIYYHLKITKDCHSVGNEALQLFCQHNWVRPLEQFEQQVHDRSYNKLLVIDECNIEESVECVPFLYVGKLIFFDCHDQFLSGSVQDLLTLVHFYFIYQRVIDDLSLTLKSRLTQALEKVDEKFEQLDKQQSIEFLLEAVCISLLYSDHLKIEKYIKKAIDLAEIDISLTGIMGKRTRFQEKNLAQLLLKVQQVDNKVCEPRNTDDKLPNDLPLDDDTLLDNIQFTSDESNSILSATEQSVILSIANIRLKMLSHSDELLEEEISAYITGVLRDPKCWCIQSTALFIRSQIEQSSRRKLERSMKQLEELLGQMSRLEPNVETQMKLFWCCSMPSKWEIQKELCKLFIKMGAYKSAIDFYEGLNMWIEAIKCYIRIGQSDKAEQLILKRLAIEETCNLWCLLGDVRKDETCYQKAWDLSEHHSSRAQRSLAFLYMSKDEYEKSLECFEQSLAINPLHLRVWFSYGCSCLACSQYDKAAIAFRRCVVLEPDNCEAWNNLSTAYIRKGEKRRALATFQEAIKCDFENVKILENYLLTAVDCGELSDAIDTYNRLIDIKGKHIDAEVLDILVTSVNDDSANRVKLTTLFARVASLVCTDGRFWVSYSKLFSGDGSAAHSDRVKGLQHLLKAVNLFQNEKDWSSDPARIEKLSQYCSEVVDDYSTLADLSEEERKRFESSIRMCLRGVISKVSSSLDNMLDRETELGKLLASKQTILKDFLSKFSS